MIKQKKIAKLFNVSNNYIYLLRLSKKIPGKYWVKKGKFIYFKPEVIPFLEKVIKKK